MFHPVIRQFAKTLRNLDAILVKATAYAEARKFPVDNFLTQRIAPDMLPFSRQVQIACDAAKAAAGGISGREVPKFADEEKTFAELRERIAKTVALLDSFKPEDFAKSATMLVKVPNPPGKVMHAEASLLSRSLPNFFFHVVTAYAILRAGGVEIGKRDYLGELELLDG
jgi:hypothetical protein